MIKSTKLLLPLLTLTITGAGLTAFNAPGAAVISETFDYATGNVAGQNGGTGFAGAWSATRNNPTVVSPGRDWGLLNVQGNAARGNAWSALVRPLDSSLSNAGLLNNGSSLWFSVIFDLQGQNLTNADLNLALGTDPFVDNVFGSRQNLTGGGGIGVTHAGGNIRGAYWGDNTGVRAISGVSSRTLNAAQGGQALIVGRIDWGATNSDNETLTLYAPDTDLNLGAPILAPWSIPALDQSQFDTLALQFKDTPVMDEIRFGATLSDVMPVIPEPSRAILFALGGLMIMLRRRR